MNELLLRKDDESDFQYHKRLIYGKLEDKILSDIDYAELSEPVYGKSYSSDMTRRMMYGSRTTLKLLEQAGIDQITDESVAAELDDKLLMLAKERQRYSDQRREYKKLEAHTARMEHLEDRLVEAANRLSESVGQMDYGKECIGVSGDNEAVLVLSDWHYGMTTKNIWNTYNTQICRQRVQNVIEESIKRIQLHDCTKLHIVILGDLVQGAIHTSARVASEELVCDQIMNVAEVLAQSIDYISQYVQNTVVHMTYGNHARTVQKKDDNIHRDNMERIIPWWMAQRLKDRNDIHIVTDTKDDIMFFEVCGYGFCAGHGDLDAVKTSPRLLSTLLHKKLGKDVDYILLGDKHHRESFEELGISSMICGSLCGTDEYANNKRLYSLPEQTLLIVSPDIGVDAEYHLRANV